MRILMVSGFYPPFIGGTERQVQLLSHELAKRGHTVAVVTLWHKGLAEEEDDHGVTVYRLKALATRVPWFSSDANRRHHPPFPDPAVALILRQLIKRFQPQVVHACGWIAYSCVMALIGSPIPFIVSIRDYGYTCPTQSLLHNGEICSGPRLAKCVRCSQKEYGIAKSLVATLSVAGNKLLLRNKIKAVHSISSYVNQVTSRDLLYNQSTTKLRVIPDLLKTDAVADGAEIEKVVTDFVQKLPDQPFILFVGALRKHKGVAVLLEAYKQLPNAIPLVLIGTKWHDTPPIPEGIMVFHNVPHQAVMAIWDRCLMGIVPSTWAEPLGDVVLEAMQCGKAVIGSRVGGIPDIISDEQNGLLVPSGDANALCNAMQRLIQDHSLRDRLGNTARDFVRKYSVEQILPQFEQLYDEVINTKQSAN